MAVGEEGLHFAEYHSERPSVMVEGSLVIHNGEGSDHLLLSHTLTGGDVEIVNGHGDSYTSIGGTPADVSDYGLSFYTNGTGRTTVAISGSLVIENGDGTDHLLLSHTWVDGDVMVANGHGDSYTSIGGSPMYAGEGQLYFAPYESDGPSVVIEGSLGIHSGDGSDHLLLSHTVVGGDVEIANGNGDSHTSIGGSPMQASDYGLYFGEHGSDHPSVGIRGNLVVENGEGIDYLLLSHTWVGGNVRVANGNGDSYTSIGASPNAVWEGGVAFTAYDFGRPSVMVEGSLGLDSGDGTDYLLLSHTHIGGDAAIRTGNGESYASIGGSPAEVTDDRLSFHDDGQAHPTVGIEGNLVIENGEGEDHLAIFRTRVAHSVEIHHGDGDSHTLIGEAPNCSDDGEYHDGDGDYHDGEGHYDGSTPYMAQSDENPPADEYPNGSPQNVFIGGSLTISSGEGFDDVVVSHAFIAGDLGISTGDGGSSVQVRRTITGNDLAIFTEYGEDVIELAHIEVEGETLIETGDGDDLIEIMDAFFDKLVKVDGGAGSDKLVGKRNEFAGGLVTEDIEELALMKCEWESDWAAA